MDNENRILSLLETLVTKVEKLEQGQVRLENEVKEIKAKVDVIEMDAKYLKSASREAFKDIEILDNRTELLIK